MSPVARAHCLVAAGGEMRGVQLADPVSGAFTHVLSGHRGAVLAAAWSLAAEHELLTGDASGEVRVWDVRRPGGGARLDYNHTQRAAPPPAPAPATRGSSGRRRRRDEADGDDGNGGGGHAGGGRAVAHDAAVTALLAAPGGLHWVTGGADARLRLWDAGDRRHLLVHYPGAGAVGAAAASASAPRRPVRLAATEDGRWLFQPAGASVNVFDLATGAPLARLKQGHFEPVTACAWSPLTQQLYTAGCDGAVLAWAPHVEAPVEDDERAGWARGGGGGGRPDWAVVDEDAWSDDDGDEDGMFFF